MVGGGRGVSSYHRSDAQVNIFRLNNDCGVNGGERVWLVEGEARPQAERGFRVDTSLIFYSTS